MRNRLMACAFGLLACCGLEQTWAQRPEKPNIVFILADDLGYGDLGCYGQKVIRTPRLDRMAREGMRFTQCYAGSTVCAPSRAALMTGLHTGHARIRGNKRVPLLPEDLTVAEVLREAGYRTSLVGKWGLGDEDTTGTPNRKGFDEFYGFLDQTHAHTYFPEFVWRDGQRVTLRNREDSRNVASTRLDYVQELFTEEALGFVRRNRGGPFFLYLAYTVPHANNERAAATGDGMEILDYGDYADRDWKNPQKGHAAMISRLDSDVGRVLDLLAELRIDEKTIVFFSSDNGPHKEGGADPAFFYSNGPHRGHKRDLYDGGIRVPGIVRWPGVIPAGSESDHVWAFWDFLPTAAELAGATLPGDVDGISIVPTLTGQGTQRAHDYLYWEFHEGDFLQAVLQGDWKAVRSHKRKQTELFDLSDDPSELRDVAEQHADRVRELNGLLDGARTYSPDFLVPD